MILSNQSAIKYKRTPETGRSLLLRVWITSFHPSLFPQVTFLLEMDTATTSTAAVVGAFQAAASQRRSLSNSLSSALDSVLIAHDLHTETELKMEHLLQDRVPSLPVSERPQALPTPGGLEGCFHHLKLCLRQSLCPVRDSCSKTCWEICSVARNYFTWRCLCWYKFSWASFLHLSAQTPATAGCPHELYSRPGFYIVFSRSLAKRCLTLHKTHPQEPVDSATKAPGTLDQRQPNTLIRCR